MMSNIYKIQEQKQRGEYNMIDQLKRKLAGELPEQIASLTLHFTENCNLKCQHCSYALQKKEVEVKDDVIDEVLSHNPFYTCIVGGGEPTFLRDEDRFNDILNRFPDRRCYIISNGVIIPKHIENWRRKIDFYRVSLDAASPETYLKIHGVDYYFKVRSNIEKLLKKGVNKVGVTFVNQKNNFHEIFDFLKEMAPYFYKYGHRFFVKIKPLRAYDYLLPIKNELDEIYLRIEKEASKSILFRRFLEEATNFTELPGMYIPIDKEHPVSEKCYYSLLYVLVTCEGIVYPCGLMSRKQKNSIGNLNKDSWSTILKRQSEFFENINPKKDECCRGCWDDKKNQILHEIIINDINVHPELTKLGGISTLYCRY